jgi:hypothetical protein
MLPGIEPRPPHTGLALPDGNHRQDLPNAHDARCLSDVRSTENFNVREQNVSVDVDPGHALVGRHLQAFPRLFGSCCHDRQRNFENDGPLQWANRDLFAAVRTLLEGEVAKHRPSLFKNILNTLNHPW